MNQTELKVNAIEVFEIRSKQHWINSFPGALPELPLSERYIWVDSKGNTATCGEDFMKAETQKSYPIKIYLLARISHSKNTLYYEKLLNLFK